MNIHPAEVETVTIRQLTLKRMNKKEYSLLCFGSAQLLYMFTYQWKGHHHGLDWFDLVYECIGGQRKSQIQREVLDTDLDNLSVSFENFVVWANSRVQRMYNDQGILSIHQRLPSLKNEARKHYFCIPLLEVLRVLGYQRYLSRSDDLDYEIDVFDHISSCYTSLD